MLLYQQYKCTDRRSALFQNGQIRDLLTHRQPFHPLPRDFYVNPDIYEADLACIFNHEWIFAGHTFELEKPGSYLTLQVGHYAIVVVRGKDDEIRAFHNVCRHRGAKICSANHGQVSRFVCPYHQWAYRLDGSLQFARFMGEDLDKSSLRLKPVNCETVSGFIFVCVDDNPRDFHAFRQHVEPFLRSHELEQSKVAYETNIVEKGNWKLVLENNRECYHCDSNHPQLMRSFVEDQTVAGIEASDEDSNVKAHWARCEKAGFPSALDIDGDGQFRMVRVPLADGTYSYTMSGMPAVRTSLGQADGKDLGVLLMFHYPSTWVHVLSDHAISFRVLPISRNETLLTTKWIVHKDAEEGRDYDIDNLTNVWAQTNEQDRQLVERAAQGVASPAFEPGPFSPQAECGPNQFVDWYCRTLGSQVTP